MAKYYRPVSGLFLVAMSAILCLLPCSVQGQGILDWPSIETSTTPTPGIEDEAIVSFRMNGAKPNQANATVCTGFRLKDASDFWIIQVGGVASWSTVHHLGLYGCDHVPTGSACSCKMANRSPIYSWSRYTKTIRLTGTDDYPSGFHVGGTTDNQFLFIETHYHSALATADTTSGIDIHITRTTTGLYDAMVYSVMAKGTITNSTAELFLDACVTIPSNIAAYPLQYIGHQAHSHNMGRLVSAYIDSPLYGRFEIGRGNPLWPQIYRPSPYNFYNNYLNTMIPGDPIYSRCYYTSTGVSFDVNTIGPQLAKTQWTEMCISNIIVIASYSGDRLSTKNALLTGSCTAAQSAFITSTWPQSTQLLPSNTLLDTAALYGFYTGEKIVVSSDYTVNLGTELFTDFL